MPAPIDYRPIIRKLLEKSDAGKLAWKQTYDSETFTCSVEGDFTLEVREFRFSEDERVVLIMRDSANNEIFKLAASRDEVGDLTTLLFEIFESARRVALEVDNKLSQLATILDRI